MRVWEGTGQKRQCVGEKEGMYGVEGGDMVSVESEVSGGLEEVGLLAWVEDWRCVSCALELLGNSWLVGYFEETTGFALPSSDMVAAFAFTTLSVKTSSARGGSAATRLFRLYTL